MTYEEYERQNELEDAIQDDIDGIVENMDFDQYADDGAVDFGKLADVYEAMTEEEHKTLKEIAPSFYEEVQKMHEDSEWSCIPAVKAWDKIFKNWTNYSKPDYAEIGKALPELKKALDGAHDLVLEHMEALAKEELANYQPDF